MQHFHYHYTNYNKKFDYQKQIYYLLKAIKIPVNAYSHMYEFFHYKYTYSIFPHLTPFIPLHLGELDVLRIGPDGCLSDCIALNVTDGYRVVITGQGQQVLVAP